VEFYISMDCEHCDEEIFYGVCITTIEHNGRPVIPFDMAAQTRFVCNGPDGCGETTYTGDFDVFTDDDD
jgi:hypothetical protein